MDVCLRVLKESNKSRFDSYSVRNSELIVSHITFRDCRVYIFSDNFSRNSCMLNGHSAGSARGFSQLNKVELDLRNRSQQIKSTRTYQQTEEQVSDVKGPALEFVTKENTQSRKNKAARWMPETKRIYPHKLIGIIFILPLISCIPSSDRVPCDRGNPLSLGSVVTLCASDFSK